MGEKFQENNDSLWRELGDGNIDNQTTLGALLIGNNLLQERGSLGWWQWLETNERLTGGGGGS